MSAVESRIRVIIADILDVNEASVVLEASIREDLGADSLDLVEIISAMSQVLNIQVNDDEVHRIKTIGEMLTYVNKQVAIDITS
jgi:acyl carrier protein